MLQQSSTGGASEPAWYSWKLVTKHIQGSIFWKDLDTTACTLQKSNSLELTHSSLPRMCSCLGVLWNSNFTYVNSILKACRAFFSLGNRVSFMDPGKLNHLSAQELIETCVMPVYICMAVNHGPSLTASFIKEKCEIGERTLRVPRIFNNLSALWALDFPTMHARNNCTKHIQGTAKLSYLLKIDQDMHSQHIIRATNINNLFLVQECNHELEEKWEKPSPPR